MVEGPSGQRASSRKWKLLLGLLIASTTINIALFFSNISASRSWTHRSLSPYGIFFDSSTEAIMLTGTAAQLARDLPVKSSSHPPFGLGSATEAERAITWESLNSSAGEII